MKIVKGQKVKDTSDEYKNDIGTVEEVQETAKGQYVCVEWGEGTVHGDGTFGRYKPTKFGMFKRFRNL